MRIDTILYKSGYKLPNNWFKFKQYELKKDMLSFMQNKPMYNEFVSKLSTYSDFQYGDMCTRLSRKKQN